MKEYYKCYIKTLSPVHIGCDEVYEPMGFLVDEPSQKITVFDPVDFISSLEDSDREKFLSICRQGDISSILEIYKFLKDRKHPGKTIEVCSGFVERYRSTLEIPLNNERRIQKDLNQFKIERTSFLPGDQRPFIPGSSVKGALRTAYLNLLNNEKKIPKDRYSAKNLEKTLLDDGAFATDPFRLVKVSDFSPVGDVRTKIVFAVNEKKKDSVHDARGPYQILETIIPGAVFEGIITFEEPLKGTRIKRAVSKRVMLECLKSFYGNEQTREEKELGSINISSAIRLDETNRPFRIGRHSGAESVTIDGHRSIKIMGKNGSSSKFLDKATTFWLASEEQKPVDKSRLLPFGWCELSELTAAKEKDFREKENFWREERRKAKLKQKELLERQAYELKRQAELKKEKEAEEKRHQEEAERRKAELDAMSPEDRVLAELEDVDITESKAIEIYNNLDEYHENKKILIALALKKYWISHNKWEKKHCSKKQLKKVGRLKQILNNQ